MSKTLISADNIANGGDNLCEIWLAFAKRYTYLTDFSGLGVDAMSGGEESFDVPEECQVNNQE